MPKFFYERVPLRSQQSGAVTSEVPEAAEPTVERPIEEKPTEDHYRLSNADLAALGGGDTQVGHEILSNMFPYMLQEPGVVPSWGVTILGHGNHEAGKKILDRFTDGVRAKHRDRNGDGDLHLQVPTCPLLALSGHAKCSDPVRFRG